MSPPMKYFSAPSTDFLWCEKNDVWRKDYYGLFECIKRLGDVSFSYILEELYRLTGNVVWKDSEGKPIKYYIQ